jgi:hypothetical protein
MAAVAAVALFAAGVVVWRMTSAPEAGPVGGVLYVIIRPSHRLHPLRAESLWAASAPFAVVAIGISLRQKRRPGAAQTVSG